MSCIVCFVLGVLFGGTLGIVGMAVLSYSRIP